MAGSSEYFISKYGSAFSSAHVHASKLLQLPPPSVHPSKAEAEESVFKGT